MDLRIGDYDQDYLEVLHYTSGKKCWNRSCDLGIGITFFDTILCRTYSTT